MSESGLQEEVALRIGLAVRELPEMDPRTLVNILIQAVGTPITTTRLAKLRKQALIKASDGKLDSADENQLKKAMSMLKGRGISLEEEPLPDIEERFPEEERTILVACCSNTSDRVDGHFGSCSRFLIFEVGEGKSRLVDIRSLGPVDPDEDKNALRANLIADCQILCTVSIGGPATAKVVRAGLHPIKLKGEAASAEVIGNLENVLGNPPPWLAKVMGDEPEERIRFQGEAQG